MILKQTEISPNQQPKQKGADWGETASLIDHGVVTSSDSKAPLHITLPANLASRWMPGLYLEPAESGGG